MDTDELPPRYWNHPVTIEAKRAGEIVFPAAIYMDGLPYSQVDGVIAITVINLATNKRFVCVVFRKRHLCKCGCKGCCSLYALHRFVAWRIEALGTGTWPTMRHDGTPFLTDKNDSLRAKRAGQKKMHSPQRAQYPNQKLSRMGVSCGRSG